MTEDYDFTLFNHFKREYVYNNSYPINTLIKKKKCLEILRMGVEVASYPTV